MKFLYLRHPYFNRRYRRIATVAFCFGWALFELVMGSAGWSALFAGLGAVAGWVFFFDWQDIPEEDER